MTLRSSSPPAPDLVAGGVPVALGARLGAGGEGEVYAVEGAPALAVKLYTGARAAGREAKIAAMVRAGLADAHEAIAFPREVVERGGAFAGFAMARVGAARPLHEITSGVSRRRAFPQAGARFLARTALNAARAVAAVHATGCVIGDVNHSGFLITDDARVMVIDADSFQFRDGETLYHCAVGVPEYTAPELLGRSLAAVERTEAHDAFALAVVLFQLLFLGRHPFAGIARGPRLSVAEAMRAGRFAYSERRASGLAPPPGALRLGDFPAPVAASFEDAFGADPGARPAPSRWIEVLAALEADLRPCAADPMHAVPAPGAPCPFCRVETQVGAALFSPMPPVIVGPPPPFDARTVRARLATLDLPDAFRYVPPPPPAPALEAPVARRRMAPRALKWAACLFTIGAGVWLTVMVPQSFVMLLIVAAGAIQWLRTPMSAPARSDLDTIDRQIARLVRAIQDEADLDGPALARAEAQAALAERERLGAAIGETERHFRAERADAARRSHLARVTLEGAPLAEDAAQRLAAAGVASGADVLRRRDLPLGAQEAAALRAWAAGRAAAFVPPALSAAERAELARRQQAVAARAPHLEARIAAALARAEAGAAALATAAARREPRLEALINARSPLVREIEGFGETAPAPPDPEPRRIRRETAARLKALARA